MFDMLLKQMLPPGFDLEKTIAQVTTAIQTTVATVQRIEAKIDALQAAHDANKQPQGATVTQLLTQDNQHDDRQQHDPAGNDHAAPGHAHAGPGGDSNGGHAAG